MNKAISGLLLIVLFVIPGYFAFIRKRIIDEVSKKILIYLASECAFAPKKWNSVLYQLKNRGRIKIPLSVTLNGMLKPILDDFSSIVTIWFALLILIAIIGAYLEISLTNTLLFFNMLVIIASLFLFYCRSVTYDLKEIEEKVNIASTLLFTFEWWKDINLEMIDILYNEIKLDFDLYKKETEIGSLFLLIGSSVTIYLGKQASLFSGSISILLFLAVLTITITKWLYEAYRTKIIRISLGALLEIKKILLTNRFSGHAIQRAAEFER
ncbi:hypothetical protein G4V39_03870 [Thermosulfuriphilus ammonigenes]|uniref:Uncharacterized protein n=1 Tax=Thermosulfuriphilus ammonigenes TaxID=1936021 RepID=A0A6G7PUV9_9BACT|nr:hypothetical protein [Thermosulfuriphilus ammonigenes]MBA2848378.1 heme A synthase [Thermosulfuriphilus ammonigenes]QIJ71465.1 hypothetical protein G4V39_03870 [Thermosulfuriphilus ammonigenes]